MAISVLEAETLVKAGVTGTEDIARVTPGVVLSVVGAGIQPTIRGVSSQGAAPGDSPNIAIYIDDVYQPNLFNFFDLTDVSRIEVLKGPQGTLYGQNATGGAMVISTFGPGFTPEGRASISYGNFNDLHATGRVAAPLTDGLAFSISGSIRDRDGFRRHVVTGERDKGFRSRSVRGKLLFQPDDAVKLVLSGWWSKLEDSSAFAGIAYRGNTAVAALIPNLPFATSSRQFESDPLSNTTTTNKGGSLVATVDTSLGELKSVSAYSKTDGYYFAGLDFSPARYAMLANVDTMTPSGYLFSTYVQEINFASRKMGRFTVTAGAFYLNGKSSLEPSAFEIRGPSFPPGPYGPLYFDASSRSRVDRESWAAFAEFTYDITDRFILSAGGRYSIERQRGYTTPIGAPSTPLSEFGSDTFRKFVPRVTARYQVTASSNVYASVSQGFKSGLIQTMLPSAQPEVLTSYEIGYKGRPAEWVELNLSAYYYDYKDLQVFHFVPGVGSVIENAAKARVKGVDLDVTVAPTDRLTVKAGGTFLDAKYRSFPEAGGYMSLPTGGNVEIVENLSGARMLRAPKFSGTLSLDYRQPTEIGEVALFGSLYHSSDYQIERSGKIVQGDYTTLDAELSFSPNAVEGLKFALWGRNLTDETYFAAATVSTFADGVSYAPPRTYGIRAEYSF